MFKLQPKQLAVILIALALSGCDSASQLVSRIPQLSIRPHQQQLLTTAQSPATARMEAQTRQQVNAIRRSRGLKQLQNNEKLASVARSYSRQMAQQNFFGHISPSGETMVQRVEAAGIFYFVISENLFKCTNVPQPAKAAVQGWMNSPGHRENILRPEYRETGIGIWQQGNTYYFTQLLMRSLSF